MQITILEGSHGFLTFSELECRLRLHAWLQPFHLDAGGGLEDDKFDVMGIKAGMLDGTNFNLHLISGRERNHGHMLFACGVGCVGDQLSADGEGSFRLYMQIFFSMLFP